MQNVWILVSHCFTYRSGAFFAFADREVGEHACSSGLKDSESVFQAASLSYENICK